MNAKPRLRLVSSRPTPTAAPDEEIATFDQLYRRYAAYVAVIGLRILGSHDQADDVVQDVFLEAHRSFDKIEPGAAGKRWLAVVAVRAARKRLRRRKLWAWLPLEENTGFDEARAPQLSPKHVIELRAMYRALGQLPVDHRIAWTLSHVHGEQLTDVADLCGCSLATIKRRLAAAHASLSAELGHD